MTKIIFVNRNFVLLIKRIAQQVRKHMKQLYVSCAEASIMVCALLLELLHYSAGFWPATIWNPTPRYYLTTLT